MSAFPPKLLPLSPEWQTEDTYVDSLLSFATGSDLFRNLCGGVHILDFLTREPDLYTTVLPQSWREWFDQVEIDQVLDLLLRRELPECLESQNHERHDTSIPYGEPKPPQCLVEYVRTVRKYCLLRQPASAPNTLVAMPRHIAVGMKPKKIHEVSLFARYVDKLAAYISQDDAASISGIVDFGSGQNYLGRTLASPPYRHHVYAVERKHHNINGAKGMDVHAKLAAKEKIMRNKKEYKRELKSREGTVAPLEIDPLDPYLPSEEKCFKHYSGNARKTIPEAASREETGLITYIEHDIQDGYLEDNVLPISALSSTPLVESSGLGSNTARRVEGVGCKEVQDAANTRQQKDLMVVSLHSCGNLIHHGLRSLVLNPSVAVVAMIGCCYNLMTERLGPATYKLPTLRPLHPRLDATSNAFDPRGFPMSQRLEHFEHRHGPGVRLNITARMMAVQAPYNWGVEDSQAFFKRHFYRALLQRILLDRGVVRQSSDPESTAGGRISGKDTSGTPLIVGSLRQSCFVSFRAYVYGAISKLREDRVDGDIIRERTSDLTDDVIDQYEAEWAYAKKNLSVIWCLMAFSAGVVESMIAVDRWLYLREQECVERCWVEPVFDYAQSPRNLVIVGVKRKNTG